MAIIKCPECNHDVSDHAISCPNCGYPIASSNGTTEGSNNNDNRNRGKRVSTTITIVSIVVLALIGFGCWWIFVRGGSDAEEQLFYDKIVRFERENNVDSLENAMNAYLDMYNSDAHHYSAVKDMGNRFFVERDEWHYSERQGSIEAIHRFLDQYPDGYFREKANNRLDSMLFVSASIENTKDAYENYLNLVEEGRYMDIAKSRIDSIDAEELRKQKERMLADSIAAARRDSLSVDYDFFN